MGNVNVDISVLKNYVKLIRGGMQSIETAKRNIMSSCQELGGEWNDKKYRDLEQIITDVSKSLTDIEKTLRETLQGIAQLLQCIEEYENLSFPESGEKNLSFSQYFHNRLAGSMSSTSGNVVVRLNSVGVSHVNLNGIPHQIQEMIASSFERMAEMFPESIGCITSVTVSMGMHNETPASTGFDISNGSLQTHMYLNPYWFANENLNAMLRECEETGQWAGSGIGGIINHEIGHAMHLQLDAAELGIHFGENPVIFQSIIDELRNRWINNTTTNAIRDTVLNNLGLTRDDICDQISDYADSDGSECFAECVADVSTSTNPSEISHEIIREYYSRLNQTNYEGA